MFSNEMSMALMVSAGSCMSDSGNGARRTGDVREVAFSNLCVYARTPLSPFFRTSSMMGMMIFMMVSEDFCDGRLSASSSASVETVAMSYTFMVIRSGAASLGASSTGAGAAAGVGLIPSFSAHLPLASPVLRLTLKLLASRLFSISARVTPAPTALVRAK